VVLHSLMNLPKCVKKIITEKLSVKKLNVYQCLMDQQVVSNLFVSMNQLHSKCNMQLLSSFLYKLLSFFQLV